ncbi:prolyl 4-hydroxylase [Myriangium duriaei CBS 260.36]|uniref:Prolyl 4-hydroxylase n=1 Tax=Myriangium duriaei CBS 260.36 TaxID=1168546 RepID=A0A9P4MNS8_9PEZI|nr:prolyl 4-hydroxylase [Myriangium duriaei CBS 260.36]
MAKRKRNSQVQGPAKAVKPCKILTPPWDDEPLADAKVTSEVISLEELELTVDTLQTLAEHPSIIKSRMCKDLRAAVYDFRQACTTGVNTVGNANLTARVSAALTDGKYTDALIVLAEIRIRGETPKLGALCRWVRDLDVVSGLSMQTEGVSKVSAPRSAKDLELLRVLDAVMRVTGPTDPNCGSTHQASEPIALQEVWDLRSPSRSIVQINDMVADRSILHRCPADIKQRFRILETTEGVHRKPPNLHPAVLQASCDDAVLLDGTPDTTCHKHPVVPNLRLIKDVLSPDECVSIIAAMENLEFVPDAPIRDEGEETSVLAHNVYWIIDNAFHDRLWLRVKDYVPQVSDGRKVRGINRRFRVYRYVHGAEYRCHIDGAWPPSGIDPVTDAYRYDASPSSARQSSLYTFLIYLNEDFGSGETTFFIPSVREGIMNAYPVKPVMGSVAVFPHGEAKGALLHEGTGVKDRAKYIIRTDVEYDVDPFGPST